jgi:hypothetical protein
MRLRPSRSAWVVIHSETSVSPSRVRLSSRPMAASRIRARQVEGQDHCQQPVGKHAHDASEKQVRQVGFMVKKVLHAKRPGFRQ